MRNGVGGKRRLPPVQWTRSTILWHSDDYRASPVEDLFFDLSPQQNSQRSATHAACNMDQPACLSRQDDFAVLVMTLREELPKSLVA